MRKRIPAELRIGARQSQKGFEAHAWVELSGTVINDSEENRKDFAPFGRDIASLTSEPR